MKNLLMVIGSVIILSMMAPGCTSDSGIRIKENLTGRTSYYNEVEKFNFEGHDYLRFYNRYHRSRHSIVIHNPECKKCKR